MTEEQKQAFCQAVGLEDAEGNLPINGFTLADHTDSVLADGVYAEDKLGRLTRHDNATTGGVLVVPQKYTGMQVVDFTGKGGSNSGTVVVLDELKTLFAGAVAEGDKISIYGTTDTQLNPADLPNVTPAYWGISFGNTEANGLYFDFWDFSNEAGTAVYQDSRKWTLEFTYLSNTWVVSSPACFAMQGKTAAAGGTANAISGAISTFMGLTPTPGALDNGVFTIPMSLVLVDSGTPFTTGEARVSWDLSVDVIRA
jgi:hypothetical protein